MRRMPCHVACGTLPCHVPGSMRRRMQGLEIAQRLRDEMRDLQATTRPPPGPNTRAHTRRSAPRLASPRAAPGVLLVTPCAASQSEVTVSKRRAPTPVAASTSGASPAKAPRADSESIASALTVVRRHVAHRERRRALGAVPQGSRSARSPRTHCVLWSGEARSCVLVCLCFVCLAQVHTMLDRAQVVPWVANASAWSTQLTRSTASTHHA